MNSAEGLVRRLSKLDQTSEERTPSNLRGHLRHFVEVWQHVTDTGARPEPGDCVTPAYADSLIATSRVMNLLKASLPEVADGLMDLDHQYWVRTSRLSSTSTPTRAEFVDARHLANSKPQVRPFGFGLYSSTGVLDTYGMWRIYLDVNRGSSLFPLPWQTWALRVKRDVNVLTVSTAQQWADFVLAFRLDTGGLSYPDWKSAAETYDGVHLSLSAVAAIQGLPFRATGRTVPPSFWDVETTLWLRWPFDGAELVDVVSR